LLVGDDGKVVRVIRAGESRPHAATTIDAKVERCFQGLIDAHGHVLGLGFAALQLDLVGTSSLDDLKQRLKTYARRIRMRAGSSARLEPGTLARQTLPNSCRSRCHRQ
jgi:predicted amidohydrolase YtcJ